MIENIEINGVNKKIAQSGKPYFQIETSAGKMGCWDAPVIAKLQQSIGKTMSVDYVQNDQGFKNILKVLGEAKVTGIQSTLDAKKNGKAFDSTSMYVSYAKDIFVALLEKSGVKEREDFALITKLMAEACSLVKKAKKLIESPEIEPDLKEPKIEKIDRDMSSPKDIEDNPYDGDPYD